MKKEECTVSNVDANAIGFFQSTLYTLHLNGVPSRTLTSNLEFRTRTTTFFSRFRHVVIRQELRKPRRAFCAPHFRWISHDTQKKCVPYQKAVSDLRPFPQLFGWQNDDN